jgi:cation transport ATPase
VEAIIHYGDKQDVIKIGAADFEAVPGYGMKALVDGKNIGIVTIISEAISHRVMGSR